MQMTNLFENSFQTPFVKRFEAHLVSSQLELKPELQSSLLRQRAPLLNQFFVTTSKKIEKFSLRDPKTQKKSCFDNTGVKFQHFLKFTSNRSSSISLDFNLNWSNFDEMQFHCELGWGPLDKDELSLSALKHSLVIFDFMDPVALWPSGNL